MRLLYVLNVKSFPAAFRKSRRVPLRSAGGQCSVVNLQLNQALSDIQSDRVAGADQRDGSASSSFGRGVQYDSSVRSAAHSRIGDPDHVCYSLAQQFRRKRHVANLRHTRITPGATVLKNQDTALINVKGFVIDARVKLFDRFEGDGSTSVLQ
jgi:hypothetical protein